MTTKPRPANRSSKGPTLDIVEGDELIGKVMEVQAPHFGHSVIVRGRDAVEKHGAYWLQCSCGEWFLMGEANLPHHVRVGTIPAAVIR